jgi:dihydrofolate reductase
MRIILYIAVSLDGFIADKDGGVAWLDAYNTEEISKEIDAAGCGFQDFYKSIDALIIGNTTYKQMLTFGPWTFADKISYVFAASDTPGCDAEYVECINTDIPTFMKHIASKNYKRVWLVGGAMLAESFYKLGLIDEYIITIVPSTLGQGIPLLPAILKADDLTLVDTKKFNSGIVQKHYVR